MKVWKKQKSKITIILIVLFIFSVLLLDGNKRYVDNNLKYERPIGEITVDTPIDFRFIADQDYLSGVELLFATYEREHLKGLIDVTVDIADENILKDTIDISTLNDNSFYLIDFPVHKNSYGKEVRIQLQTMDLQAGNTVTLWTENTVREGTKLVFGGNILESTIVYREQVEKGLNKLSICLLLILIVNIFLTILFEKIDDEKILYLLRLLDAKELEIVVYIFFGVLLIVKMGFYSAYVARFPDETAHLAYIAYLEKTNRVIPEFENMYTLSRELTDNFVSGICKISEVDFNYLGHSPLYYLILKVTNNVQVFANGDVMVNLLFLRWISQGIGLLGVIIYFYVGYKNINSLAATVCYASVTTLMPMFAYGLAGITNDTLALVGVAVLFWGMSEFEEGKNGRGVFLLIGIGVFFAGLSKLTCGMIIGIAGFLYVLSLTKRGQIKRVACREFVITIPFYILVIGYYMYILKVYGVLQPSLSVIAPEYFIESDWYVSPENRIAMSFLQFTRRYWHYFFDTWISIWSGVVNLSKDSEVWRISGIGTFSIFVFSFFGTIVSLLKKEGGGILKVSGMFMVGVFIAIITQFFRSYRTGYLLYGRFASFQSRYYLCCIGVMAFLVCYVFNLMAQKTMKIIGEVNSKRDLLIIKMCGIFACICYAGLLLYDDIIYFLINFSGYFTMYP